MEKPTNFYAHALTIVTAAVLVLSAFAGLLNDLSGSADAEVSTATIESVELVHLVPANGQAVVIEQADEALPQLNLTIPGDLILAAYIDTTTDEWVEAVVENLWPEPTPVPTAAPVPVVTPAPVVVDEPVAALDVETGKPVVNPIDGVDHSHDEIVTYNEPVIPEIVSEPIVAPSPVQTDGWAALRNCESTNNYAINTGNGFYGAYQFTIGTWNAVAAIVNPEYVGIRPDLAPPAVQDQMAYALRYTIAWGGWQHWPICGRFIA